jgi:hypothetical protein
MSTHAANQSISSKRTMALLKRLESWFNATAGAMGADIQHTGTMGQTVAAGAAIVPDITNFVATGSRVRVRAWASFTWTNGASNPTIAYGVHGGPLTVVVQSAIATSTGTGTRDFSIEVELPVGAGQAYDFNFSTATSDAVITLGHSAGLAAISAAMIVSNVLP